MAQRAVEGIVNAFQQGMRQVLAQKEFEANKQAREDEFEERKKESEENKKLQKEAADRMWDLQRAQLDMAQSQHDLASSQAYQQSGITPPGYQVLPGVTPTPSQPLVLSGLENSQVISPQGKQLSVPPLAQSPIVKLGEQQRMQANLDALNKYRGEADINFQNQLKLMDATMPREITMAKMRHDWDMEKEKLVTDTQKYDTGVRAATQLKIASMAKSGMLGGFGGGALSMDADGNMTIGGGDGSSVLGNLARRVMNGETTQEDINAMKLNKGDHDLLNKVLLQADIKPLNNKQRDRLKDLNLVSGFLPKLDQMYDIFNNSPFSLNFGFTDASRDFKANQQIIEGNRAAFVRVLEGSNRYTHQQAEDISKELIPQADLVTTFRQGAREAQNQKYDFFVRHQLQDSINAAIGDLSPAQQRVIRAKISIPNITQTLQAPGGEPPQPTGTTGPRSFTAPVQQPGQDRVVVYDTQTGRTGTQLKKFVDSNPK